jgi:hypothetical protein
MPLTCGFLTKECKSCSALELDNSAHPKRVQCVFQLSFASLDFVSTFSQIEQALEFSHSLLGLEIDVYFAKGSGTYCWSCGGNRTQLQPTRQTWQSLAELQEEELR